MAARGWAELDILFISGDAYVDHPAFGVPLLARLLEQRGYRVGILPQPDWRDLDAFRRLGRPRLFVAVSAGAMDSMVNHYTAAGKVRNDDAYTPGGRAGARPDRALIVYTAAVKGALKGVPVVIGGIEASLRRLAHYDYWSDRVRRSVLVDSKADLLVYGMAERALLEIAGRAASGEALSGMTGVRGTARVAAAPPEGALQLPGYEAVAVDPRAFGEAFRLSIAQDDPAGAPRLAQQHGNRWLVVETPAAPLSGRELDGLYGLPFQRRPYPGYSEPVPAYAQIRFSITTHRGCYGGCAFCAITAHQGRTIQSRSETSVLAEIESLTSHPEFRGTVSDLGGPTANMYGTFCRRPAAEICRRTSCLVPALCPRLETSGRRAARLLQRVRKRPGVSHAFVASGIRYDLLERQEEYFEALLAHHVGGRLKVAPESTSDRVCAVMRKPGAAVFLRFLEAFRKRTARSGKRRQVVPYLMAGHPGCTLDDMVDVALFLQREGLRVEQVQEFTPTPGSLGTCLYYTGRDPFTGMPVHVPRSPRERRLQKALLLYHLPENRGDVREALRRTGREEEGARLLGRAGRGEKRRR